MENPERAAQPEGRVWAWFANPAWTSLEAAKLLVSITLQLSIFYLGYRVQHAQRLDEAAQRVAEQKRSADEKNAELQRAKSDALSRELANYSDDVLRLSSRSRQLYHATIRLEDEISNSGRGGPRARQLEDEFYKTYYDFEADWGLVDLRLFRLYERIKDSPIKLDVREAMVNLANETTTLESCMVGYLGSDTYQADDEHDNHIGRRHCDKHAEYLMDCPIIVEFYSDQAIELLRSNPDIKVEVPANPELQRDCITKERTAERMRRSAR